MSDDTQAATIRGIGQIALIVRDLDRAVAFYRDVVGLRFLFRAPPALAFFDAGGTRLMLGLPEQPGMEPPGSILYYRVDDIRAAFERLKSGGAGVVHEPRMTHRAEDHELWLAFFNDPEGNLFALMAEVPL